MDKTLIVRKEIYLGTTPEKVWEALTNPEMTKQYMYGCALISNWKVGDSIVWQDAEKIQVKGEILEVRPEEFLKFTVFDPNTGLEDIPSNYLWVSYELIVSEEGTLLKVAQGDFAKVENSTERFQHTEAGWDYAFKGLKTLLEP